MPLGAAMSKRTHVIIAALAVVAMCGFIFFMSARPSGESGAMSMEIVQRIIEFVVPGFADLSPSEQLAKMKLVDHIVRKIAHFSEYALLGILAFNLVRLLTTRSGQVLPTFRWMFLSWALATAYAITDEVHQIFVPGRSCMPTDVLIDSAGVLAGVLLFVGVLALVGRVRSSRGKAFAGE